MSADIVPATFFFGTLLFAAGLYCMLVSRNILRQIIGVEIIAKGCVLFIIGAGCASGRMALAQAIVITMIAVEVVVAAIALGLAVKTEKIRGTLDIWKLSNLRD